MVFSRRVNSLLRACTPLLLCLVFPSLEANPLETTAPAGTAAASDQRLELGRRMYMEGLLPSGKSMSAIIQGDIAVTGAQVSCGACHRRSGLGSTEGQQVVPGVTGGLLYKPLQMPTTRPPAPPVQRPAYSDETLKQAIREGVDANGQPLDPFMPRYTDLSDEELDILLAYLNSLSTTMSAGVTDTEMHFATIVADSAPEKDRKALLDVMRVFFEQKNIETRAESSRAANAPWHKSWIFGPYRKWVLHRWELHGPSETWNDQLHEYYRQQPVFAVLSGVAPGSWEPMHRFCEDTQVPCIFPTTDLPVVDEESFYSIYFSKGMTLEAQVIATHLQAEGFGGKLLRQVLREGDLKGETAARALRDLWEKKGGEVQDYVLASDQTAAVEMWQELSSAGDAPLILWLTEDDLQTYWSQLGKEPAPERIYLSTTLYGEDGGSVPMEARDRVYFVHPSELPNRVSRLLARSTGWLRFKRIYQPEAREVQANAYFATKVAGQSVRHIRGYFYSDYFIERIENMLDNAPYTSIYPRVSLAPGQKFVAKGGYIAKVSKKDPAKLTAVTGWIIAR